MKKGARYFQILEMTDDEYINYICITTNDI